MVTYGSLQICHFFFKMLPHCRCHMSVIKYCAVLVSTGWWHCRHPRLLLDCAHAYSPLLLYPLSFVPGLWDSCQLTLMIAVTDFHPCTSGFASWLLRFYILVQACAEAGVHHDPRLSGHCGMLTVLTLFAYLMY